MNKRIRKKHMHKAGRPDTSDPREQALMRMWRLLRRRACRRRDRLEHVPKNHRWSETR